MQCMQGIIQANIHTLLVSEPKDSPIGNLHNLSAIRHYSELISLHDAVQSTPERSSCSSTTSTTTQTTEFNTNSFQSIEDRHRPAQQHASPSTVTTTTTTTTYVPSTRRNEPGLTKTTDAITNDLEAGILYGK